MPQPVLAPEDKAVKSSCSAHPAVLATSSADPYFREECSLDVCPGDVEADRKICSILKAGAPSGVTSRDLPFRSRPHHSSQLCLVGGARTQTAA
ncbi:hypothetical protein WJX72_006301 [[Myrmecia] bisecta]|uniref:Uncharacterized protein n=1 Tax=[Myrmecia] bisecta TaxID=41462 RepID=A0AAW1R6V6_9CHLO